MSFAFRRRRQRKGDIESGFSEHIHERTSMGMKNTRDYQQRIISPEDPHYKRWRYLVIFVAVCSVWMSPLLLGFFNDSDKLSYVDICFSFIFGIDIVVTFFVAYKDEATDLLVFNHVKISCNYLRKLFVFDVVSCIPVWIFQILLPNKETYIVLYVIRLYHWKIIHDSFTKAEKCLKFNFFFIRCVKLLWVVLVNVHTGGCLLYLIATLHHNPEKSWVGGASKDFFTESFLTRYINSDYLAMATVSTVGYGDLHAVNNMEKVTTMLYMLWSGILIAYVISVFQNLVTTGVGRIQKFRDDLEIASRVIKRNNLAGQLHDRFLAQVTLEHRLNIEALEEKHLFDYLHKPLRSAISQYQYMEMVSNTYLFKGVSAGFLAELVPEMTHVYLPSNEDVITQWESPSDFYIVTAGGVVLIDITNGNQKVGMANAGDICGEIGVICLKPQRFTIRTNQLSRLLRVERNTFLKIVQSKVRNGSKVCDGAIVMENFIRGLKEINRPFLGEALKDINNLLASGEIDLPIKLHYAVLKEDILKIEKWLKEGLDPNAIDSNGRTALHIAASNGKNTCVSTLLKHGANPNCADFNGNVPLWEALRGGHQSVINTLYEESASFVGVDVLEYAHFAVLENNLDLLRDIVRYGGDVKTLICVTIKQKKFDICDYLLFHFQPDKIPKKKVRSSSI